MNLDLEAGPTRRLYSSMVESPEVRYASISKVYAILTIQLLLTIVIVDTMDLVHLIAHFLFKTLTGFGVDIDVFVMALVVLVLTIVIFISLKIYTFWVARRGHDFSFLGLFLYAALIVFRQC
ncbi:hypothetical protein RchiOBHm_Chr5g0056651 [Rosa chinensis]|uniref:Uncharacterized protein n=1 Tax=Rosa chinensis TaxID=74649 RepID=A0A2P6QGQ0_ROSCH|nr:hypothetical protein RchiOBHm_Chr5g0056651 [Rosa chinensis]